MWRNLKTKMVNTTSTRNLLLQTDAEATSNVPDIDTSKMNLPPLIQLTIPVAPIPNNEDSRVDSKKYSERNRKGSRIDAPIVHTTVPTEGTQDTHADPVAADALAEVIDIPSGTGRNSVEQHNSSVQRDLCNELYI